jgi:hypothetical protein
MVFVWDDYASGAHLKERVTRLDEHRMIVLAIGSLTHARDVISSVDIGGHGDVYYTVSSVLDKFWIEYPNSLARASMSRSYRSLDKIFPKEDSILPPGEDAIISGVSDAFAISGEQLGHSDKAKLATSALDRAYWMVFDVNHLDGSYRGVDDFREAELSCASCKAEIDFQLKYLVVVEGVQADPPPAYSTLLGQTL